MKTKTLPITIRAFDSSDADYEARIELSNALYPNDYVETVAEAKYDDAHRDPKVHIERWMAYGPDDTLVGISSAWQSTWSFHPRKFGLDVNVHPDWRGRGVGTQLYDHVRGSIGRFDPAKISVGVRDDQADAISFAEHRGFVELMRDWENHLDLAEYDPAPFAGKAEAVEASGVRLATLAEIRAEDPDGWGRRLFEVSNAAAADIPSTDEHTDLDFDVWYKRISESPNLVPDGFMIAVVDGEMAGISTLWLSQGEPDVVYTGLTGVRREFRRRGIALALKLRALEFARAKDFKKVKTWNNTGNQGMLSINYALGFKPQPAWIDYAMILDPAVVEATAWENSGTFVDPATIEVPKG